MAALHGIHALVSASYWICGCGNDLRPGDPFYEYHGFDMCEECFKEEKEGK